MAALLDVIGAFKNFVWPMEKAAASTAEAPGSPQWTVVLSDNGKAANGDKLIAGVKSDFIIKHPRGKPRGIYKLEQS